MRPVRLRVEWLAEPYGLDVARPRFSWELEAVGRGRRQSAYQVVVATDAALASAGSGDLWDSGRTSGADTFGVAYPGPPLRTGQRCWWTVRVWDERGQAGDWAPPASWRMGVLTRRDWRGRWIGPPPWAPGAAAVEGVDLAGWRGVRPTHLRREFTLADAPADAWVAVTALGVYELRVNGEPVGGDLLTPGWTDYRIRIPYQVYDLTPLLRPGANCIGVTLGAGWYCGRVGWTDERYGEEPALLLQAHIDLGGGRHHTISSGPGWRCAPAPMLWSDLLAGEAYDQRLEVPGWAAAGFDDTGWSLVRPVAEPAAALVASPGPRVRRLRELPARSVSRHRPGTWIVDFGQNLVGRVRLRVDLPEGGTLRLRHAEILDADGSVYVANLRTATATDAFVSAGRPTWYEPTFTVHGFRYVEVTGPVEDLPPDAVTAVVVGSDLPPAGEFVCSDELVTQLQRNIEWSQRGNHLEVPTDCPQRDERLGWTADAQAFLPTACWNADMAAFYTKWVTDLLDTQRPDGAVADVAPLVVPDMFAAGAPGWGDAVVIIPWTLYRRYGDRRLLRRCLPAMAAWVDYVAAANPNGLWLTNRGMDYGDWLAVDAPTPKDLVATAFYANSARLVAEAAAALGDRERERRYRELFEFVRAAFVDAYATASGRTAGHQQTGYVLALAFDLLPTRLRAAAAEFLVSDIAARGDHLSTGFLGLPHLMPVLTSTGHLDVAYTLLEQTTMPSWGHPVRHGATTIWERWDGWREDTGPHPDAMNSFNHYALGAVGDWLFRTVAGLDQAPDSVAMAELEIRPRPGGTLRWVRAAHHGVRGMMAVRWRRADGAFRLECTVPPNVTARVWLPGAAGCDITESGHPLVRAPGVANVRELDGDVVVGVGSGDFDFQVTER